MLSEIGFRYDDSIDPFDGGPTYKVRTDDCEPVRRTRLTRFGGWLPQHEDADGLAMIGFDLPRVHEVRFRAALVEYKIQVDEAGAEYTLLRGTGLEKLLLEAGDTIGLLPLTGPRLRALY